MQNRDFRFNLSKLLKNKAKKWLLKQINVLCVNKLYYKCKKSRGGVLLWRLFYAILKHVIYNPTQRKKQMKEGL